MIVEFGLRAEGVHGMEMRREPKMDVVCEAFEGNGLPNELFDWDVIGDQLIITANYEEIIDEEELGDFLRRFVALEEPIVIGSVECDPGTCVYDLGWNDEIELAADDQDFITEGLGMSYRTLAFRFDGQWWFLKLADMTLWTDPLEEPFSCDDIYPIQEGMDYYMGGSQPLKVKLERDDDPAEVSRPEWAKKTAMMICETECGQYGLYCDGYEDEWMDLLTIDEEMDYYVDEWTEITVLHDDILLWTKTEGGDVIRQKVTRGFLESIAEYDAELLCEDFKLDIQKVERDRLALGNRVWRSQAIRIVQDKELIVLPLRGEVEHWMKGGRYLEFMKEAQEAHPWLAATMYQNFGRKFRIMDRDGERFVVRTSNMERNGRRLQFYCIHGVDGVGGVWEDAKLIHPYSDKIDALFQVKKDGLWGIVDKTGAVVVPFQYSEICVGDIFEAWDEALDMYGTATLAYMDLNHFGQKQSGIIAVDRIEGECYCSFLPQKLGRTEMDHYRFFESDGSDINPYFAARELKYMIVENDDENRREIYRLDGQCQIW